MRLMTLFLDVCGCCDRRDLKAEFWGLIPVIKVLCHCDVCKDTNFRHYKEGAHFALILSERSKEETLTTRISF
jgi:hypothetical protein